MHKENQDDWECFKIVQNIYCRSLSCSGVQTVVPLICCSSFVAFLPLKLQKKKWPTFSTFVGPKCVQKVRGGQCQESGLSLWHSCCRHRLPYIIGLVCPCITSWYQVGPRLWPLDHLAHASARNELLVQKVALIRPKCVAYLGTSAVTV